jgi:hypothetical protein
MKRSECEALPFVFAEEFADTEQNVIDLVSRMVTVQLMPRLARFLSFPAQNKHLNGGKRRRIVQSLLATRSVHEQRDERRYSRANAIVG